MEFDEQFFQKFSFKTSQIKKYFISAKDTLDIAYKTDIPEVIFKFSYEAFIKSGISMIAYKGYRVRSKQGHHIAIIAAISRILGNKKIAEEVDHLRKLRNMDLYTGGAIITKKYAKNARRIATEVFEKLNDEINF